MHTCLEYIIQILIICTMMCELQVEDDEEEGEEAEASQEEEAGEEGKQGEQDSPR